MPKISVIIPVYNAEKYLDQCLQSVLSQSFTDFELLLINDGSKDRSGEICEAYATKDSRVKVFHQENKGVSAARNLGLDKATGEWICFVDSDDYVSETFIETFLLPEFGSVDGVFKTFFINNEDGFGKNFFYNKNEKIGQDRLIKTYNLFPYYSSPFAKLFKRELIEMNYSLRFHEDLSYGEDALFVLEYLSRCKLIYTLNISDYYYRYNDKGLSKTKKHVYDEEIVLYNKILFVLKDKLELDQEVITQKVKFNLYRVINSIYLDDSLNDRIRKDKLKNFVSKNSNYFLKSNQERGFLGKLLNILIKLKQFNILNRILIQMYR